MEGFKLFPDQASTIAEQVDLVYFVLIGLAALFAVGVAVMLIFFAVRYRSKADVDRTNAVTDNMRLELVWIAGPTMLAMGMFLWGTVVYLDVQSPPSGEPIEIYATGQQWMWKFQHANGAREINTLHVPAGRHVQLIMTSQDVIHSFYVPAFRVKQDVLPGRYTKAWFEALNPGRYRLFCAEYCGTEHSYMQGWVEVVDPAEYTHWLRLGSEPGAEFDTGRGYDTPGPGLAGEQPALSEQAAAGAALFGLLRCDTCHRTDSTALQPSTGPVLQGVFGRNVRLRNEREIIADEQYLLESILAPYAKLVAGYPPVMPTYAGQVSDTQLMQLVEFIKSLNGRSGSISDDVATDTLGAEANTVDGDTRTPNTRD